MTTTNGTTEPLPISQIEGLQTVVPVKVTHPRSSRHVSVLDDTEIETKIYKQRCHIILYYQSTHPEDSGWVFAGVTKESLGRATVEHPIMGGRLRQGKELGGDVALEVVSNDCGIRLVEAQIPLKLSDFLDLKDRKETEAELVFWKDVDEKNPQFCPLLYVQVTNFQCGGYSIGISCSLLLADPSAITNFLINWSKIHSKLVSENILKKLPLHYLPNLKSPNIKNKILSDSTKNRSKSLIFANQNEETYKKLVSICIEEAENELGVKALTKTHLFWVTSFKKVKMESYIREPVTPRFQNKLDRVGWDHFGANEISFYEGNKPVCVSNWVYSAPGEVLAILSPSNEGDSSMCVIVSIPS